MVSSKEYAAYCRASGLCTASDANRPIAGLSLQEIQHYLSWLHERTGLALALPNNQQWQQALYLGMNEKNICDYYGTGPNLVAGKPVYQSRFGINYRLASTYEWVQAGQSYALRGAFFKSAVQPYCRVMQVMPTEAAMPKVGFRR